MYEKKNTSSILNIRNNYKYAKYSPPLSPPLFHHNHNIKFITILDLLHLIIKIELIWFFWNETCNWTLREHEMKHL